MKTSIRLFYALVMIVCIGCGQSRAEQEIANLLPPPKTASPTVEKILDIAKRILISDDPNYKVPRSSGMLLGNALAKYGDTKLIEEEFERQFDELEKSKLIAKDKPEHYGALIFSMASSGLMRQAARKAEADSSSTVQAIVPYLLGRLQFEAGEIDKAKTSFLQALSLLDKAQEPKLSGRIAAGVLMLATSGDKMPEVILAAASFLQPPYNDDMHARLIASAWLQIHKTVMEANDFETVLQEAEKTASDTSKAELVRAVIRKQVQAGLLEDAEKAIDRIFPPGAPKKKVAADQAAIFGRFDGRDLCLETLGISCLQHGHLDKALQATDRIEEVKRRGAVSAKLAGFLMGRDVKTSVMYGLLPDGVLGGDSPDATIVKPNYSDEELRKFCRWYAATADITPNPSNKIARKASAAGLMAGLGFAVEADKLFTQAFDDALAMKPREGSSFDPRIQAVAPIFQHRIGSGTPETVWTLIDRMTQEGITFPVSEKIKYLCMAKEFDKAMALADEETLRSYDRITLANALIVADEKEKAKKILQQVILVQGEPFLLDQPLTYALLRADMTDEALQLVDSLPNAEQKAQSLTMIAQAMKQEGKIDEMEMILLSAAEQVEKIDEKLEGNRQIRLDQILSTLLIDLDQVEKMAQTLGLPPASP